MLAVQARRAAVALNALGGLLWIGMNATDLRWQFGPTTMLVLRACRLHGRAGGCCSHFCDLGGHASPCCTFPLPQVLKWSDGSYLEDQDMWWLSGIHRWVK